MIITQPLVLLAVLEIIVQFCSGREASVAFLCGKPTQFYSLDKQQWVTDMSTDCIIEPDDILAYCQHQYPHLNITYILPAQESVTIDNWCHFGMRSCDGHDRHTSHQVKPYRCLSGNFQSDALLVPEHCQFGHHTTVPYTVMPRAVNSRPDSITCELFDVWNHTAQHVCAASKSRLQSFGVLFPCIKDATHKAMHFSGVEYVCCPPTATDESEPAKGYRPTSNKDPVSVSPSIKDYESYVNAKESPGPQAGSEHERYNKARATLYAWQLHRRTELENQLAQREKDIALKYGQSLTEARKAQEHLHSNFRSEYASLLEEQQNQRRQLEIIHQQNVATRLDERRRRAKDEFYSLLKQIEGGATVKSGGNTVDGSVPLLQRLNKAMEHWLRAIQKDRLQSVVFLNNLRVSDPEQAQEEYPVLRDHLNSMLKELQILLDKIKTMPVYKEEVLSTYLELRKQLGAVDKAVERSMTESIVKVDKSVSVFDAQANSIIHTYEHVGVQNRKTIQHLDNENVLTVNLPVPKFEKKQEGGSPIYVVLIITGIVAVCAVVLLAVWCYRARCTLHDYNSKAAYSLTVLEDEPPVVQGGKSNYEAERLMHLQVNGFENPTYKFFENGMFPPQSQ